jgi:hypothetical protein
LPPQTSEKKNSSQPTKPASIQSKKTTPQPTKKVVPPPPPPVQELLPKPTWAEEIQLNIDVPTMIGKMNMTVPVTEMCKIPSVRREVLKLLKVPVEAEDPPIILNTMYLGWKNDPNPPFYLSLGMDNLVLQNCMLDSGASTNVMSLKVMKQLGLKTTRPYGNVCGIDSKKVKVYGLIEDAEFYLVDFPHISILMNIVVIDVPDAWGMLLSRSWATTLGGFLSMDLTHAYIPMEDGTFEVLYNRRAAKEHVIEWDHPNHINENEFDEGPLPIEYDPHDLPFMQEDSIDTLLPRTQEYKEKLAKISREGTRIHKDIEERRR